MRYVYCFLLFFCAQLTQAKELPSSFRIAAAADWVKPQQVERPDDSYQFSGGVGYLLVDEQKNVAANYSSYRRYVVRILNSKGVESESTITLNYNPAYQTLTFHAVSVLRDGKLIDKLSKEGIDVFRREKDMESQLYDGRFTANIILEDIREGDVLDYSYTIAGRNPARVEMGTSTDYFDIEWSVPVFRQYRRLLWPAKKPVFIKYFAKELQPVISKSNGLDEYIWEETRVAPVVDEEDTPGWYDEYGWIQFTEADSWQTVKNKSREFYRVSPEDIKSVNAVVSEIKHNSSSKKAQLEHAIHFVQDKIRYTGIEMGINSLIPYSPASVLERRFGDCKDKTMLFLSILKGLDIDASPVFVSSYSDDDMNRYLPSEGLFDHMIARVRFEHQYYWIDLTRTNQGRALEHLYQPDYGFALPIDDSGQGLIDMQTAEKHGKTAHIIETYDLTAGFDQPAKLSVQSNYYGYRAERLRRKLAGADQDKLAKQYVDYMSRMYPDLTVSADFSYEDNERENVLTTFEQYLIPDLWKKDSDGTEYLSIYQYEINDVLKKPDSKKRRAPFKIDHPVHVQQTTHIMMPESWSVTESKTVIDSGAVRFRSHLYGEGNEIHKDSVFRTTRNFVKTEELGKFVDDINRISDKIDIYVYQDVETSIFETLEGLLEELSLLHLCLFFLLPMLFSIFLLFVFFYKGNNPWLTSWFSPRQTMAYLAAHHSVVSFLFLVGMIGVSSTLGQLVFSEFGAKYSSAWIWGVILLLGPLIGLIQTYLWAWLLSLTGTWINGAAGAKMIRLSVAWSSIPGVVTTLVYVALLIWMKNELFNADTTILDNNYYLLSYFIGAYFLVVVLAVWWLVNQIAMLAQVQGFTVLRSIGNLFLASLIAFGALLALVLAIAIPYGVYTSTVKEASVSRGPVKEYYENGVLKGEWLYKDGKLDGLSKEYYESGKLRLEISYSNDMKNGYAKGYFENGNIDGEWFYIDDKKDGKLRRYYESGQLKGEWHYKDGKKDGVSREYYENGVLKGEWTHELGRREGIQKEYFENGRLDGQWVYVDDKREGEVSRYYENGVLKGEWQYKNDMLHGVSIEYFADGNRKSLWNYKAGKKDGLVRTYFENGRLKMEYNYKNDNYHGVVKEYFQNGNIKKEWHYENGKLNGAG